MQQRDSVSRLRDEIIDEATRSARAEIRRARDDLEEQVQKAEDQAHAEREQTLHDAEREADLIKRRARSRADVEANRLILDVRERLIEGVLEQVRARLRDYGTPEERLDMLKSLVAEAAREIREGDLVVRVSPPDAKLLTPDQLADVQKELAAGGVKVAFRRVETSPDIWGGVVLSGNDGRVVVDNTLEARLQRREAVLRGLIWQVLSGETEGKRGPITPVVPGDEGLGSTR